MKKLFAVLGVSTEDEAVISVGKICNALQAIETLTGKTGVEAVAVVTAWQQASTQAVEARAELAKIKQATADADATSKIDTAVADGRVAPASRANFESLYAKFGVEALDAALAAVGTTPSKAPSTGPGPTPPAGPVAQLTDADIAAAKALGWTQAEMLAAKVAETARTAA